ncbi:MAG TPA: DUF4190 domain-containing protein [Candidatus Thermoplasmatota archaeon]|nr:DUF4190 domain-containing protein [Candidatus Thermoplasmatota archaeon]
MPRLKCPRCATVIDVAPGATPVCPACGFGSTGGTPAAAPMGTPLSPPDAWSSQAAQPQPGAFGSPPMGAFPGQQKTSGKAIAALVLGIVSVCFALYLGIICGVIGLILGVLGMKEIDRNPHAMKGKGMAIAGIVLGSIGILVQLVMLLFFGAILMSFGECIQDPNAVGCEEFQDPGAQAILSAPAMAFGPLWSAVAVPAWTQLHAWAA